MRSRQAEGGEGCQQTFLKRQRSCFSRYFYRTSDLAKSDSAFLESDSNTRRVYTRHNVAIMVSLKAKNQVKKASCKDIHNNLPLTE